MEYIYVLTFLKSGMRYVGKTTDPAGRRRQHINGLKINTHPNRRMQDDYNKDPQDVMFEILGRVPHVVNVPYDTPEQFWMRKLKTYDERYGYNDRDFAVLPMRREAGLPCRKTNHCKR